MKGTEAQFDFAIIGGGAVGLSCAWRLALNGVRVILFDRLQPGREASYAAGGMLAPCCEAAVHPWNCAPSSRSAMLDLCFASRNLYPSFAAQLLEETGIDPELSLRASAMGDWREPGILFVSKTEKDPRIDALLDNGLSAVWRNNPAVFLPDDGQIDSRKLIDALRAAALKAGVEIRENTMVRRLEIEEGRVVGVVDDKETVRAGNTLLCAGAWSGKVGNLPRDLADAVRPIAGQMVQVRGERRIRHVIYADSCYLVPRRDGRLLVGATVEEVGFNKRVTAGGVAKLLSAAVELAPELDDAPLEAHWAGLRPSTPDGLPLIGSTSLPNLFVATGHGRNGILLAPATAAAMVGLLLEKKAIPNSFSPTRFASPV